MGAGCTPAPKGICPGPEVEQGIAKGVWRAIEPRYAFSVRFKQDMARSRDSVEAREPGRELPASFAKLSWSARAGLHYFL